jgi:anti-sigma-K factor RskA
MEHDAYNELTAAYALDALEPDEVTAYEEHLAGCEICQDNLAAMSATTVQLAYAAPPVDPPLQLRERILEAARAERQNVVPLRPRGGWHRPSARTAVAAAAAIAACLIIGLGVWNVSLSRDLDDARKPQTVALDRARSVVAGGGDKAVLVVSNLDRAPAGMTYQAWVIDGDNVSPAGVFEGGGTAVVKLEHPVRDDSVVAVTVERGGGSEQPTGKPFIVKQRV